MISTPNDSDLEQARSEARHLRETVEGLREALEESDALLTTERQRFRAELETQAEQARDGVAAIRLRLEAVVLEKDTAVQSALARSADEITQLQATVEALRVALTTAHEEAAAQRETVEREFRAEREQLHEMITALRALMETADAR